MLATFNMTMLAGQIRARCLGEEACYVDAPLTEAGKQLNDYILRARELTEMFEIRYISF